MKQRPSINTTKLLVVFLFANFTLVEIYSMVAMWHFGDLSALYTLIATVLAEPMTFAVYAAKAYKETKESERLRLERDKLEFDSTPPLPEDKSTERNLI